MPLVVFRKSVYPCSCHPLASIAMLRRRRALFSWPKLVVSDFASKVSILNETLAGTAVCFAHSGHVALLIGLYIDIIMRTLRWRSKELGASN